MSIIKSIINWRLYWRGRNKAFRFVTGPIKLPKALLDNWLEEMPKFKDKVFQTTLHLEAGDIQKQVDKVEADTATARGAISQLEQQKERLLQSTSEKDAEIDDTYYQQNEERIKKDIGDVNADIAELKTPLDDVAEHKIEQSSDKVERRQVVTEKWFKGISINLKAVAQSLSKTWLALTMLLFDWVLAVTFFEDLAKTTRDPRIIHFAMAYVLPLVITLLAMWLMHITASSVRMAFRNGIGKVKTVDLAGASLAGMGLILILGLVLVFRLQIAQTPFDILREVLFWSLFTTFVVVVGYEGSKPDINRTVNDFVKIPVLLILNAVGLIGLSPLWILEKIWVGLVGIFSGLSSPTPDKLRELKRRMKQLEDDKQKKQEQLDKLQQERSAFRKSEITRAVQEREARLQAEIKAKDEKIKELQESIEKLKTIESDWRARLGSLRKGCDDGVGFGLKVRNTQDDKK